MTYEDVRSLPFKLGWWGCELPGYRSCDSTYCLYPYESLPPLAGADERLEWLGPLATEIDDQMRIHRAAPGGHGRLREITAAATALGLTLPESFRRLMSSPALQDRIPSATACYFKLSERIASCPGREHAYVIGFLRDQQDVLLWYLYLTPQGEQCVLVSPFPLEEAPNPLQEVDDLATQQSAIRSATYTCAISFASFIYRLWLEQTLWFKLSGELGEQPLTPEEQRYLAHYTARRARD